MVHDKKKKFWSSRKLYVDITGSFLVVLLFTSISISFYSYRSSSTSIMDLSDNLITNMSQTLMERTVSFVKSSQDLLHISEPLISSTSDVNVSNLQAIDFMKNILIMNSNLSSIKFAAKTGEFLQLERLAKNPVRLLTSSQSLPTAAKFALRFIESSVQGESEVWYYINTEGKILDEDHITNATYMPKDRSWYKNAVQKGEFQLSDVYVLSNTKQPGVTASLPLNDSKGDLIGVVAIDVHTSELTKILSRSKVNDSSLVLIVNSSGDIIADSEPAETIRVTGTELAYTHVFDYPLKYVKAAFNIHEEVHTNKIRFSYGGIDYIGSFVPFPAEFGKNWSIVTIVPLDGFMGAVKQANTRIILMSFMIILLSSIFAWMLARRIAGPIMVLSEQARKIKNFDLEEDHEIKTHVYEIQLLSESITAMRHSMRSFSKFIPKVLVGKLLKKNREIRIGGEMQRITLFFSDIENFTTVSEGYSADKLVIHLSEYFEEVTAIIMKLNGTVDKYIGDSVMAFWGAPTTDKNQAYNACRAALSVQNRLRDLNRKWQAEGKATLRTRIGIHTGDVIVGNIGSSDRMNYTAIGDSVNLASRLEGVNKMYETNVIISEEAFKELGDKCVARPLDVVAVKGKNQGVKIYELLGLYGADPTLFPTQDQIAFAKLFARGFQVYLERRWDEAIGIFTEVNEKFGKDFVANMYIQRCTEFKNTPPPEGWEGVVHLTSK